MLRSSNPTGYDWWTLGAQKGVEQPPYVIREGGRWWRTPPLNDMSDNDLALVRSLPRLEFGMRRCMDYLNRRNKHFRELPLWRWLERRAAAEGKGDA